LPEDGLYHDGTQVWTGEPPETGAVFSFQGSPPRPRYPLVGTPFSRQASPDSGGDGRASRVGLSSRDFGNPPPLADPPDGFETQHV